MNPPKTVPEKAFQGLRVSHSSTTDVLPDTPTFTFYGSSFTSPYLTFTAVETATNQPDGHGGYTPLQSVTPAQMQLWQSEATSGTIPFVSIGGRYAIGGATYDASVLQGLTATQVASQLSDPGTAVAQAVVGTANTIAAAICATTGHQPAAVCQSPGVAAIGLKSRRPAPGSPNRGRAVTSRGPVRSGSRPCDRTGPGRRRRLRR